MIFKPWSVSMNMVAAMRRGSSSSAFRFSVRSAEGLDASIAPDAKTDEDASWRGGWAVSGAQGRVGTVCKMTPRLEDDEGAGLLDIGGLAERSQVGFGPADA